MGEVKSANEEEDVRRHNDSVEEVAIVDEPAEILSRIEYGFGMRRSFSSARRGKDGRSAENRAINTCVGPR